MATRTVQTFHPADPKKMGDKFGATASYRKHPHRGLDYSVASGTPLKAVGTGRLVGKGWSDVLGWWLEIRVAVWDAKTDSVAIRVFSYCHLLEECKLEIGTAIFGGKVIAKAGNTGSATTGSHLHMSCGPKPGLATGKVEDPLPWITSALTPQTYEVEDKPE